MRKEIGNTEKFYQSAASNWVPSQHSPGQSMRAAGSSNLRPYFKTNQDNNMMKKGFQHMMPINNSSYLIASNPNSMRDQGLCRNAVYSVGEPEPGQTDADSMYLGQDEFLGSSANFDPNAERLGYIKSSHGDRKVQGVLEYRNRDLYSFGGRTRIQSAMPQADIDLNDSASRGHSYFEVVKGVE